MNSTTNAVRNPFLRLSLTLLSGLAVAIIGPHELRADWLHWRGSNRDDVVNETSRWNGKNWPIREIWRTNVGEGSSSPVIVGSRLYTMGWKSNRESLVCLDTSNGKELWKQGHESQKYGRRSTGDKSIYSGPSSTPEYDVESGWIYTLGIDGELTCRDANANGRTVWGFNLYDRYKVGQRPDVGGRKNGGSLRDYGYTTSPLVLGDRLIVEVGDTKTGTVMGYDKKTGQQLWASECRDEAGHTGGLVPMTVGRIPCVVVLTMRNLIVVRTDGRDAGTTLASYSWTTDFANNIPTPAISGNSVIVTTAYNKYAMCRVDITPSGAKKVWEQGGPSGVCSPVIHDGHIYWAWRGIHCVDFATGKQLWKGGKVGSAGSCVMTSDDRLIVYGDKQDLYLIESATRAQKKYTELARHRTGFRRDAWPHVTLDQGQLYCRDRDGNLVCFQLARG